MKHAIAILSAAMVLAVSTNAARAEFYIGGALGHAATEPAIAEEFVTSWNTAVYGSGFDCDTLGCYSDQDPVGAAKFFAGYRVNPWFAVEGFITYLGSYDSFATDGWTEAYATAEIGTVGAAAVGLLPLGSGKVSLLGKLGLHSWSAEGDFSVYDYWIDAGASGTYDESDTDFMGGLGVHIDIGDRAAMRVEYEYFAAEATYTDFGFGFLSISGMFRF